MSSNRFTDAASFKSAQESFMSGMIINLGTKLFKSVTDRAGDLGEKFEEEFSRLSIKVTAQIDTVVVGAISLFEYIKAALVILSILLIITVEDGKSIEKSDKPSETRILLNPELLP